VTPNLIALCGVLLALSPQATAAPAGTFFVRLAPGIEDEKITPTAHALVRTYGGRIRLVNLRGFQVEVPADAAGALAWDERVEMVARYPPVLEEAPACRFAGSSSHGEREYRVRLADSGRRYDEARVAEIALELAAQYRGTVVGAFAPSIGRPWVVLKARPPWARALAGDKRVAWVAERGDTAFAVSPEVSLEPLPRGSRKPPVREAKRPEPRRGTLQRAIRHFKDGYFVVVDPSRADVSSATAIAALADEISAATGAERLGGEFLKPPQGFRVSGTEEAAQRIARDPRVKWVEEVGPYLRTTDPRPGEYGVAFRKAAGAPSGEPALRKVAEDLAEVYGGRLTGVWLFGGFALADMAPESARALSEDPRVEFVEENCCVGPASEVPS
jgi:hypothetical protein